MDAGKLNSLQEPAKSEKNSYASTKKMLGNGKTYPNILSAIFKI